MRADFIDEKQKKELLRDGYKLINKEETQVILSFRRIEVHKETKFSHFELDISANVKMNNSLQYFHHSDLQMNHYYTREFFNNEKGINFMVDIPLPVKDVNMKFLEEFERLLNNSELDYEDLGNSILKYLNTITVQDIIEKSQRKEPSGIKVTGKHYSLEELVEIKKYLAKLGEL